MRNSILIVFCCLGVPSSAQSWTWARHIGGEGMEFGLIGHVDAAGNAYVFGNYARAVAWMLFDDAYYGNDTLDGRDDSFVAKYDADGGLVWMLNCSSPLGQMYIEAQCFDTLEQAMYIAGRYYAGCTIDTCTLSAAPAAAFLAKLNTEGHCLWARNVTSTDWGDSFITALAVNGSSDVYLAGHTKNPLGIVIDGTPYPPCSFLAQFHADGSTSWVKQVYAYNGMTDYFYWGGLDCHDDELFGLATVVHTLGNDSLLIDTVLTTGIQGAGFALSRIDPVNGVVQWLRFAIQPSVYPASDEQLGMDALGNIYYAGGFHDTTNVVGDTVLLPQPGIGTSIGLLKYDINGDRIYLKQFGADIAAAPKGLDVQGDGTLLLTGLLMGTANFDSYNVTSDTDDDVFISSHDTLGVCTGVVHAGAGEGCSVVKHPSGIYVSIFFPREAPAESIFLDQAYSPYGFDDVIFAKHDNVLGIGSFREAENNELIIYANPNTGSFRVKVPDALLHEQDLLLSIFDASGKLIRAQGLDMNDERPRLDLYDVAKGLYTVTLSKGEKSYHGSMVVE